MRGVKGSGKTEGEIKEPKETVKKKICKIDGAILKPYIGKEDLPKEELDSKGNVKVQGESRYFVTRAENCYKLIRMYRAKGIKRRLVRVLKIKKQNERGARDKAIFKKLKEAEIPGAF